MIELTHTDCYSVQQALVVAFRLGFPVFVAVPFKDRTPLEVCGAFDLRRVVERGLVESGCGAVRVIG